MSEEGVPGEAPLGAYRVLDLADEKGCYCGKLLGDLGMDVVKVERPGGDPVRFQPPFCGDIPGPERGLVWHALNTSKKGITLDIEQEEGQGILRRLVAKADFLIESFPPGYLTRLGLDYRALSQVNAGLILTSITPFGQSGPFKDYRISSLVADAVGGLAYITGDPDRAPLSSGLFYAYIHAGLQGVIGSLIAHHQKARNGYGQQVDVSIQESVAVTLYYAPQAWLNRREIQGRHGTSTVREGRQVTQLLYPCRDGFIMWRLFTGRLGGGVRALAEWMDAEGMAGDLVEENWEEIDISQVSQEQLSGWEAQCARFFLTRTVAELNQEATRRGIPLFPVNTVADVLSDPQLASRKFWMEVAHPGLDASLTYPGMPFVSNETEARICQAPLLGEHNEAIYRGELGLSAGELRLLKDKRVI